MKNQKVYHIIQMIAMLIILACCIAILLAALASRKDIQGLSFPISFQPCHAASSIISAAGTILGAVFIRTPFNYNYKDKGVTEIVDESSQTVPDDSLTVRQLLNNYMKGIPIPEGYHEHYVGQTDFDSIPSNRPGDFDLSDITEARINRERIESEIAFMRAKRQERQKADELAAEQYTRGRSEAEDDHVQEDASEEANGGLASELARQQPRNKGGKK